MASTLSYASPAPAKLTRLSRLAFIFALLTGPIAVVLDNTPLHNYDSAFRFIISDENISYFLYQAVLLLPTLAALILNLIILIRHRHSRPNRRLALWGILISLAWPLAFVTLGLMLRFGFRI